MRIVASKSKNGTAEPGEAERLQKEDNRLLQQLSRIDERTADETEAAAAAAAAPHESHTMHVDGGAEAELRRAEEVSVSRKERGRAASETLETFAMREIESRLAKAGASNVKDLHELAHDAVSLRGEGGLEGRFANMKSKGGRGGKDKGHAKGHAAEEGHGAPSPSLGLLLSRNGAAAKSSKVRHGGRAPAEGDAAKPAPRMSAEEAYLAALDSKAPSKASAPSAAVALAAKAQSKHRMDPRLRGMAVALAASATNASTSSDACVNTGCEHGSESPSVNYPNGRNACPCPCPCEIDENTNQNLDERVSPSPPPAEAPALELVAEQEQAAPTERSMSAEDAYLAAQQRKHEDGDFAEPPAQQQEEQEEEQQQQQRVGVWTAQQQRSSKRTWPRRSVAHRRPRPQSTACKST